MGTKKSFSWLHFSDLHWGTGEIEDRGNEYGEVNEWLGDVEKNLAAAGITPVFLLVPGNHDLDRNAGEPDSKTIILEKWDTDKAIRDRIWDNDRDSGTWKYVQASF